MITKFKASQFLRKSVMQVAQKGRRIDDGETKEPEQLYITRDKTGNE